MKELLIKVREKIADKARWTQHTWALDAAGRPCDEYGPGAVCWCVRGAINVVCGTSRNAKIDVLMKLCDVAEKMFGGKNVVLVNDTIGHAAVLEVIDAAIKEVK